MCVISRAAQIVHMLPRQRAWGRGRVVRGGGHFRGCAKHSETYQKTVALALRKSGMKVCVFFALLAVQISLAGLY